MRWVYLWTSLLRAERSGEGVERLVTVNDVRERYGCTSATARKYLRQMFHYENPVAAPLWAFEEWEQGRARMPEGISRERHWMIEQKKNGTIHVPRKRGAKQ